MSTAIGSASAAGLRKRSRPEFLYADTRRPHHLVKAPASAAATIRRSGDRSARIDAGLSSSLWVEYRIGGSVAKHDQEERLLLFLRSPAETHAATTSTRTTLVGKIIWERVRPRPSRPPPIVDAYHIQAVYVAPAFRGQDWGRWLVSLALTRLLAQPRPCVVSLTAEEDLERYGRLVAWYQSLGFRVPPGHQARYLHHATHPAQVYRQIRLERSLAADSWPSDRLLWTDAIWRPLVLESDSPGAWPHGRWMVLRSENTGLPQSCRCQVQTSMGYRLGLDEMPADDEELSPKIACRIVSPPYDDACTSVADEAPIEDNLILDFELVSVNDAVDSSVAMWKDSEDAWNLDTRAHLLLSCRFRGNTYYLAWDASRPEAPWSLSLCPEHASLFVCQMNDALGYPTLRAHARTLDSIEPASPPTPKRMTLAEALHEALSTGLQQKCWAWAEQIRGRGYPDWAQLLALVYPLLLEMYGNDFSAESMHAEDYLSDWMNRNADTIQIPWPEASDLLLEWTQIRRLGHSPGSVSSSSASLPSIMSKGPELRNDTTKRIEPLLHEGEMPELTNEDRQGLWQDYYADLAAKYALDGMLEW